MKRYRSRGYTLPIIVPVLMVLASGFSSASGGEDLRIATQNVSTFSSYAREESERIFHGLEPDIALLQEWTIKAGDTYPKYVERAFGPDFYYFLGRDPNFPDPIGIKAAQNNGIVSRWAIQTMGNWTDETDKADFAWAQIDLPGEIDLLAVSVHLKADAGEEAKRLEEAQRIKSYVEDYVAWQEFTGYIVVGGDLNTLYASEWCIQTFATFLEPLTYRPEDRLGDENTNKNRTWPYDWIMPNQLLDDRSATLVIGTEDYEYEDGIVFDSWVFSRWTESTGADVPLWNIHSVLYGDSHSSEMDHMAVMRAFDVFPSPTPSPSTTATQTPTPSPTPTLIPTPTPTSTPSPPPTAPPTATTTPTIKPTASKTPTPQPTATAEIVPGPITGWVYDRETGEGIADIYVRALAGGMVSTGISNNQGYYSTGTLNLGTYVVYADVWSNRDYRAQYYDQKDEETDAANVPSNTSGIDFPLYRRGDYPSPTPAPSPEFRAVSIDSGDYDGDGTSDVAIFRRSTGLWAIQGVTRVYFGGGGSDQPTAGDFDGDGTTDIAIFRDSDGLWAIRGVSRVYFGRPADIPIPGDYNGDGYCDIGIFRKASGLWAIRDITRSYFGGPNDQPVPFNGAPPEKYIAIFRPATGLWAIKESTRTYFGTTGDTPIPANYQGLYAGATQLGIFRDANGLWAIRGTTSVYYGQTDDRPVPGNYQGTFKANITIFRGSTGLWSIRGVTRLYFGSEGDLPVSGLAINPSSGVTP